MVDSTLFVLTSRNNSYFVPKQKVVIINKSVEVNRKIPQISFLKISFFTWPTCECASRVGLEILQGDSNLLKSYKNEHFHRNLSFLFMFFINKQLRQFFKENYTLALGLDRLEYSIIYF